MEVLKLQEASVFSACFFAGICIGVVFDFFRALRKCFIFSDLGVAVQDLLFWLVACVFLYGAIYISNNAELRMFEWVGFGGGTGVYGLLLSKWVIAFLCTVLKVIAGVSCVIVRPFFVVASVFLRVLKRVSESFENFKSVILCILHKLFLKTSHKIRVGSENICKKCFFTFLKR